MQDKKIKLRATTFPDNSMKIEVDENFQDFSDCNELLIKHGFKNDMQFGYCWKFVNSYAFAFVLRIKHDYLITIYPK